MSKKCSDEKLTALIIRNVPEDIRQKLKIKAAQENKSMQGIVLELITKYVDTKKEKEG